MKLYVSLITISLSLIFSINAQDFSIRLFATDNIGNKDTIEFGLFYNSTLGIDSIFNEQDIYLNSWNDLYMRVIQRDSIEHNCLKEYHWLDNSDAPNIYYETNRDSKIDIRPISGSFGTINMNFEILIKSLYPPVFITTDFSEMEWNFYAGYSALHLLDNSCNTLVTKLIYYSGQSDTIYVSYSNTTTLVAEFQHEVSIEKLVNEYISVYLDDENINIKTDSPVNTRLYNLLGKELLKTNISQININNFSNGVYIIRISDENENILKCEKIIIKK
ncbi:MAG: hypothetical protein A2033_12010 [Bacteroidetes bacterium GWA2_31_9]|nr:MAG: hypothetical protein A2033_12010 [Bacteroidetes bacterium GWA2_31_9]